MPAFTRDRGVVIPPSIDPLAPKNEPLQAESVRAVLVHTGLVQGEPTGPLSFLAEDGTPRRVDRRASVMSSGQPPVPDVPLVVQISRWDALKDHAGVMRGFTQVVGEPGLPGVELVLAGPETRGVADDPEAGRVFADLMQGWEALPASVRTRVHLAMLPMDDVEENAVIVNALQRYAAVVVQKSLREGFGLTVTEAMWKGRAVIASRVGGIQDQVEHNVSGLLLDDPTDIDGFAGLLRGLLLDARLAERLGANAQAQARERFLPIRHLEQYERLIEDLDETSPNGG